jgi:hypothetical protein
MSYLTSPNMNLIIPGVGTESGPTYANDVNTSLTLIDQHDHSAGRGVQITPNGININATLPLNNNILSGIQAANFLVQNSSAAAQSLFVKYGTETPAIPDLWYNDGTNPVIQITSGGAVYAPAASIPGQSYSAGTFIWKQGSGSSTPANFDIGSVIIRPNTSATTLGVTVSPSTSLATSLTLYLPPSLPSVQSFMTLDSSGAILAPWTVDGSTINITGNQLVVNTATIASGLTATQAQVDTGTATGVFLDPATFAGHTNVAIFNNGTHSAGSSIDYTWTAPAGVTFVTLLGRGGAGGGGGGSWNNAANVDGAGGGGGGAVSIPFGIGVTPGGQYNITIGAGGAGGNASGGNPGNGSPGGDGSPSLFKAGTTVLVSFNNIGKGGGGGIENVSSGGAGGAGGASIFCFGGSGGTGGLNSNGAAGNPSVISNYYGTGGILQNSSDSGGGGGGAGDGASDQTSSGFPVGYAGYGGYAGMTYPATKNGSNGIGGGGGAASAHSGAPQAGGTGSSGQIVILYSKNSSVNTNS